MEEPMNDEYRITPSSLKSRTETWKKEIAFYNVRRARPSLKSSCLLVVDMQNFFLDSGGPAFLPGGLAVLPNVSRLIKSFRNRKLPVIYTAHVHKSKELDGGIMGWWWEGMILEGTREAEIHPDLAPRPEDKVIYKHRYSAFYNTDLETVLRCLKVTDLVITGVMTNLCCESTARDAYFRDYRVFFPMDATGAAHEELHLATLKNLAYGFALVTTADEILRGFVRAKKRKQRSKAK
jgi:nicotinamidase-related amidase